MTNSSEQYFSGLNNRFGEVIKSSFETEHDLKLTELFQFVDDLTLWQSTLNDSTDTTILVSAIQEYELGFQAAVCGQYRYAFIAHRYFLEQICRFVYLSTNELHLRHWKLGLRDISWGAMTDNENGIFSKIFIRAFYPEVDEEGKHMLTLVRHLYRESSEFVHGNFEKIKVMPSQIECNSELLGKWLDFMETSKFVAIFLLFMRFGKDLNKSDILLLEEMARDELCGIEEFRLLFAE